MTDPAQPTPATGSSMAELGRHRYMLVLLLLLLDVLFAVLAPDGEASRLIGLGLLAIVLVVVIVTSGHRVAVRRRGVEGADVAEHDFEGRDRG